MIEQYERGALPVLQEDYLRAMVSGSGRAADRVIEAALDRRVRPQEIYLEIFQPTAYAMGRLWQRNQISVAQEHLATAIIERQMGELHPLFKAPGERGRTLVIGCVPGEWHRVGARMVADFFEAEGWEVHYLGASVPIGDMVGLARETGADVVGLSAQMLFSLPQVGEFVRALRAAGLSDLPVIAGGMPFTEQPEIAGALNVVGCGSDAAEAVAIAERLFGAERLRPRQAPEALAGLALGRARERLVAVATERRAAVGDGRDEATAAQIRVGFDITTRMLEAALAVGVPEVLDAQVAWGAERQQHDGVTPGQVLARFTTYAAVVHELLPPPDGPIVGGYVEHLIACQRRVMRGAA
jgi:methanogenic corrinoid protein MtbC1